MGPSIQGPLQGSMLKIMKLFKMHINELALLDVRLWAKDSALFDLKYGSQLNEGVRYYPGLPRTLEKGQNDGNPCAYSEKPTSRRKFLGFPIFHRDF